MVTFRALICVFWLLAVTAGLAVLSRYERTAGSAEIAPSHWPAEAGVQRDERRPTLLLFAHPKCPCTRATIGELNRLLSHCEGRLQVHVLFFAPGDTSEAWVQSDLWKSAAAIPGVAVHFDRDAGEAKRFGAETSGHALLYDVHGELRFSGGITAARGHAGDNAGENAIVALAHELTPAADRTPVFGCCLSKPKSDAALPNIACTK